MPQIDVEGITKTYRVAERRPGLAAPAAGPLFLLAALRVWGLGVRHYRSTGS